MQNLCLWLEFVEEIQQVKGFCIYLYCILGIKLFTNIPNRKCVVSLEVVAFSDKKQTLFEWFQEFFSLLSGDLTMEPSVQKNF